MNAANTAVDDCISIHASTWEAARMHFQQAVLTCNFNSRLYMRGSFKAIPKQRCKSFYFNSRLYMRGSFPSSKDFFVYKKFQFTPLHERQQGCVSVTIQQRIFQFTPVPEGQQLIVSKEKLLRIISIHASTWEAAMYMISLTAISSHFNSRLYMRGSAKWNQAKAGNHYFNSRLYMRGSTVL